MSHLVDNGELKHKLPWCVVHQMSPVIDMTVDRSKRYEKIDFLGEGQVRLYLNVYIEENTRLM